MDELYNESLDIRKIVKIILEKWFVFVISAILCSLFAVFIVNYVIDEEYEGATSIYVYSEDSSDGDNVAYSNMLIGEKMVKDYRVIAKSNRVLDKVRAKIPDIAINPSKISIEAITDTRILRLSVKNKDPYYAAVIANEVTSALVVEAMDITNIKNISIIDEAKIPDNPVKVPKALYVIIAFFLGVLLGIGIILLIELFDRKIKSPDDIRSRFGLPVLALIPQYDDKHHTEEPKQIEGEEKASWNNGKGMMT